jgi:hypothetical protein
MSELTEQTLNDLINTLDNICTLHEKQASLEAIDYAIEQARVLLKEINSTNDSYIDTVLTDLHKNPCNKTTT